VNRKTMILISILSLSISMNCKKNKTESQTVSTPTNALKKEIKKIVFFPPSDSLITSEQMTHWLACNPLLDSLAIMYADSFKVENAQSRLRYQDDYSSAQDKICVLSGLQGGYKEYKWIMDNAGNPKNKSVIEAVHATVY
jgi:hypothetical protein